MLQVHTQEAVLLLLIYLTTLLKSIASRSSFNLHMSFLFYQPATQVTFNPGAARPGSFQIYSSVDWCKMLPFYRLVGLFHFILLFPATVLSGGAPLAALIQENVAPCRRQLGRAVTVQGED